MRIITVLLLALLPICAHGKETTWNFMTNRGGCVPLAELPATLPEAKGANNPDELLRLLKRRYPEAKLQRFWDAVAETEKEEGRPSMTGEERAFWKSIDVSNIFSLTVKSKNIELGLMPEEVCKHVLSEIYKQQQPK